MRTRGPKTPTGQRQTVYGHDRTANAAERAAYMPSEGPGAERFVAPPEPPPEPEE